MNERDYVTLGPAPSDEDCVQVGDDEYFERARAECKRFIALLREICGTEPSGAYLTTKSFPHDFGDYLEVVCYFNPNVPASIDYAFRCEREAPTTWASPAGTRGRGAAEDHAPHCPECGGLLEPGNAFSLSALLAGDGYLCTHCRIIFAHDLTFLATYVR